MARVDVCNEDCFAGMLVGPGSHFVFRTRSADRQVTVNYERHYININTSTECIDSKDYGIDMKEIWQCYILQMTLY